MVSKVKSVQANGTWESQHGTLYKFDYEFDNGVAMQANHKTTEHFHKVGTLVEYEVKREGEYGKSGTVQKYDPQTKAGATPYEKTTDVQTQIIRQSSLKVALDFLNVNPNVDQGNFTLEYLKKIAENLTDYVKNGL